MISMFKPYMHPLAKDRVADVLSYKSDGSLYIGEGALVEEFERELTKLFGFDVLTVNSGTAALDLALAMIGIREGDEVLVTPITCSATISVIVNRGAIPVWVDTSPLTGLIDAADIEKKITTKSKAIMAVNWGGSLPDYAALKLYGLPVIEDAAHGAYWSDKPRGDYICGSFQAIKSLTTGDGGWIHTPDQDRARKLRWFGLDRRSSKSVRCEQNIAESGYKYHMNDIAAAIGLANITQLESIVRHQWANACAYTTNIKNEAIVLLPFDKHSTYWIYSLLVDNPARFIAHMKQWGIEASQVHRINSKHDAFASGYGEHPNAVFFDMHQVALPVGWWISIKDIERVVKVVNSYEGDSTWNTQLFD